MKFHTNRVLKEHAMWNYSLSMKYRDNKKFYNLNHSFSVWLPKTRRGLSAPAVKRYSCGLEPGRIGVLIAVADAALKELPAKP
jgi:hypothetical protein